MCALLWGCGICSSLPSFVYSSQSRSFSASVIPNQSDYYSVASLIFCVWVSCYHSPIAETKAESRKGLKIDFHPMKTISSYQKQPPFPSAFPWESSFHDWGGLQSDSYLNAKGFLQFLQTPKGNPRFLSPQDFFKLTLWMVLCELYSLLSTPSRG